MNRILALCLGFALLLYVSGSHSAQSATMTGLWEFDDAAKPGRATVGVDLSIVGAAPVFSPSLADAGGTSLPGVATTVRGRTNFFRAAHGVLPNGGGTYVNEYSILIDLFSPAGSRDQWRCLFQTNPTNGNDGDYFIRTNNQVGVGDLTYSAGTLDPTRWARLVLTFDLDSSIRTYVDGALFHTHRTQPIDGRFSLDPTLLFFGDEDLENFPLHVGTIAMWDGPLTEQEVAALGRAGSLPPVLLPSQEVFQPSDSLPPNIGHYVSPSNYHQLYPNGVSISNIHHYSFDHSDPPPPPGGTNTHSFGSLVEMDVSLDGVNFSRISAPAAVRVLVSRGPGGGSNAVIQTEMLQLDISGGGLPPGVRVRESSTLRSTGRTTQRPVPGGFMVSSYFDIHTEVSVNHGATWTPAMAPGRMQLVGMPTMEIFQPSEKADLPLPPQYHCAYVTPRDYHQQYTNGYSVSNIYHHHFDPSYPPPGDGQSQTHSFNSQVEMDVRTPGQATPVRLRAPALTQVRVQHVRTVGDTRFFETEMLSLDLRGGGLPNGVAVRESPTRSSRGGTSLRPVTNGVQISSYFDMNTELTLDGGATWIPAARPARVELTSTRVFVNEWLAVNNNSITDPDYGAHEDWIELFNPNPYAVDLTGHFLANNLAMTNQFQIGTNWSVPAQGRLLVWADGQNKAHRSQVTELHTNFRLNNQGGSIGLFSPFGEAIDTVAFGMQAADQSEGLCPDGGATRVFMATPSPRTSNLCDAGPGGTLLRARRIGAMIEISWSPAGGTLQVANSVHGSWTNAVGAGNPRLIPLGPGSRFYRVAK